MPTGQQYATNVPQTTLTGSVNASATSLSVASSASWPSVPFTAVLDIGTSSQEPVDVTAVVGTTWTVTRNIDGTTGFSHAIGATVTHADIGRDFREARTHMDASTNVHGLSGGAAVVGDISTQTLTNKTITAPAISAPVFSGTGSGVLALSGANSNGSLSLTNSNGVSAAGKADLLLAENSAGSVALGARVSTDANNRWSVKTDGSMTWGPGSTTADTQLARNTTAGGGLVVSAGTNGLQVQNGPIWVYTTGQGFQVAEGSNAKQGTAVLVGGTKLVSNNSVTATSRIFLTSQVDGGTPGFLRVSARSAGTSFTITSSSGTDTSTVAYEIFEVG